MAQFERPDSDVTVGAWTKSTGSTLFGCIDEASLDDADYIQLNNSASNTCEVGLSNATDPVSSSGHIVRIRSKKTGTGTITLTGYLYQGTTLKATIPITLTTSFVTTTYTLSAAEADSITDYTDLRLRFTGVAAATGRFIQISWAEFEVPSIASVYEASMALTRSAGVTDSNVGDWQDVTTITRTILVSGNNVADMLSDVSIEKQKGVSDTLSVEVTEDVTITKALRVGG